MATHESPFPFRRRLIALFAGVVLAAGGYGTAFAASGLGPESTGAAAQTTTSTASTTTTDPPPTTTVTETTPAPTTTSTTVTETQTTPAPTTTTTTVTETQTTPAVQVLRVDERSDLDFVDPALAYFSHSWRVQYATCAKLLNLPSKEGLAGQIPQPEVAATLPKVTNDGRTYTFTLRKTFRFNTGRQLTAADVVATFKRIKSPAMKSPARAFFADVVSVRALGRFGVQFRLRKADGSFEPRLTMPFTCILPKGTPVNPLGIGAPVPSAGPYYIATWDKARQVGLERNPHYRGKRARKPDRIVINVNISLDASQARCERGDSDICGFPPALAQDLANKYGVNRGRFFVKTLAVTWFLALNTRSPLFVNNARLRRAVSYALDRREMAAQHGSLGGVATDQLIPSVLPGFRDWSIYPLRPQLARARTLARGATRSGKVTLWTFKSAFGPGVAEVVKRNLEQIGLQTEIVSFDRVVQTTQGGVRGAPYDILLNGRGREWPDGVEFISTLLHGRNASRSAGNVNLSYLNAAPWNRRIDAVGRLRGRARWSAVARLERDLLTEVAPVAPYVNTQLHFLVSARVGCMVFHPTYGQDYGSVCLR